MTTAASTGSSQTSSTAMPPIDSSAPSSPSRPFSSRSLRESMSLVSREISRPEV